MIQKVWSARPSYLVAILLIGTLILSACNMGAPETAADPDVDVVIVDVDVTPVPEDDVSDGDVISDTEGITGTEGMDESATMTDTQEMDTGTAITETQEMDDSDTMTETDTTDDTTGTSSVDATESSTQGFVGTTGESVVASTIMGYSIDNSADENLGSVEDLIVNLETGTLHYVIVSFGGFLGLGDSHYAVPPSQFNWMPETTDRSARLTIEITEEELTSAPVFDYSTDLTAAGWDDLNRAYWNERAGIDGGDIVSTGAGFVGAEGQSALASDLMGHGIENFVEENLGSVEDLVVSLNSGEVSYVIVSFGGFLGLGDSFYAVPPSQFTWTPDPVNEFGSRLMIEITEEELTDAPVFEYDYDLASTTWDDEIRNYWDGRSGS